ncbi:type III-A CRISPR-associated protein Csm2 [Heliobacterium gestii]|uniref:CRISPR system Cms protein Csm2 n=1 Tax=Heliomicrobium gestii TaxID=2699 RepID=A0A845L9T9_HELGE|nr:type III-A CRISPR-associated protein Csm2 [Heliomicrobium gestii]MBM7865799.1 CRISPR type III-A-associated protein Csm2 [Heliomicrobium gestii]MZP42044.1 type III-A CRISPR-associated protein Csm2 [Heliomicrobium gestii]
MERPSGFRGGQGGGRPPAPELRLPEDYLIHGYFDANSNLREVLIIAHAKACAGVFGHYANGRKRLKNSQLRRFFNHARALEMKLIQMGEDHFPAIRLDILKLLPMALYANSREKVPDRFVTFMEKNVERIHTIRDFREGFLPHFEAVVAYFYYMYPKE